MFTEGLVVSWQAPECAGCICGAQMPPHCFLGNCFVLSTKDFENIEISKSHF